MKRMRGLFLLALLVSCLTAAASPGRSTAVGSFGTSLFHLWNADDQSPEALISRIDALQLPAGLTLATGERMKLVAKGIVIAQRGRAEQARQMVAELQTQASRDPVARADALLIASEIDGRLGHLSDRLRDAGASVQTYEDLCAADLRACDYHYWSLAIESLIGSAELDGNIGLAALQAQALVTLARRVNDRVYEAYGLLALAGIALRASDLQRLDRLIAEARPVAASTGYARVILAVGTFEGLAYQERKDYAHARAVAIQMLAVAVKANRRQDEMLIRVNLGEADAALKLLHEAMAQYAEVLAYAREKQFQAFESYVLSDLVEAEVALPDFAAARRDLVTLRSLLATYSTQSDRLSKLKRLASIMNAAGDQTDALDLLQEAQKLAFSSGPTADLLRQQVKQQQVAALARQTAQLKWRAGGVATGLVALVIGLVAWRLRIRNSRLEKSRDALLQRVDRDPLTGLANRRYLEALDARKQGVTGVLFLIDLDHFKRINDDHGHPAGDAVLVEVARRLQGVVRDGDAAIRWGGEEFLIHVPSMASEESDNLAGRLLATLAAVPVAFGDRPIPISASIGYAGFPLASTAPVRQGLDEAFALVDAAMYRSKSQGRNRATGVHGVNAENIEHVLKDFDGAIQDGLIGVVDVHGPTLCAVPTGLAVEALPVMS